MFRSFWLAGLFWLVIFAFIFGLMASKNREIYDWARYKGMLVDHNLQMSGVKKLAYNIKNAFWGFPSTWLNSSGSGLPQLTLDIKFKHYDRLVKKRNTALKEGHLFRSDGDYVPAVIQTEDGAVKVKVRLKGDRLDHLRSDKWSLRVKVSGKNHIMGMRRFSLQHPRVREMHGHIIFYKMCSELGILVPRFKFIDVVLNGNHMGIMVLEEAPAKELLETQGRRNSVVFRFDESNLWKTQFNPEFYNFRNTKIFPHQGSKVYQDKTLLKDYRSAVGLLRGALQGKIKFSEVFDPVLWGRFLAIIDLWGNSYHSVMWRNVRLYYNPITARIEPIANDAYPTYVNKDAYRPAFDGDLSRQLLSDPVIYQSYRESLALVIDKLKNEGLLKELVDLEDKQIDVLGEEFFLIKRLNLENLLWRGECLLGKNECGDFKGYPFLARVFVVEDQSDTFVEIMNTVQYDLEIRKFEWFNPTNGETLPLEEWNKSTQFRTLEATPFKRLPRSYKFKLLKDQRSKGYKVRMWAGIKGHRSFGPIIADPNPYRLPLEEHFIPHSTVDEQLARHPFLQFDAQTHAFYINSGTWHVMEPIILPKDYGLKIEEGTTLKFEEEAFLFAKGPLNFNGSNSAPITLEGMGENVTGKTWMGIMVLESTLSSNWSHVTVRNTSEWKQNFWGLTGGVNFYKSNVLMNRTSFIGNRAEDALNIIHSKFQLTNIRFMNTLSDAFDSDFSTGFVKGGLFKNIGSAGGGDGIDVSGSVVDVEGVTFEGIFDKALSVGEKSYMKARRLDIQNVAVGAASKDGSQLDISDSVIKNAREAGLMAYVKKPEYGPAEIRGTNLVFMDTPNSAKSQNGNSIVIDGQTVATEDIDVKNMYKTVMKSSLKK